MGINNGAALDQPKYARTPKKYEDGQPRQNIPWKYILYFQEKYGECDSRRKHDVMIRTVHAWLRKKGVKGYICRRCFGYGKFSQFEHVERGLCFKCGGNGLQEYEPKGGY